MTDSAELARQVAGQLGGDLERILGSLPDSSASVAQEPSPSRRKEDNASRLLELRQIAGRGAGRSAVLTPGVYDVGPKTSPVGLPGHGETMMTPFRLRVEKDLSVTLIVLDRPVSVDGRRVADGLRMRGGVINAISARFEIGEPVGETQPPPTSSQIIEALPSLQIPIQKIPGVSVDGKSRRWSNKRGTTPADFPELAKAVLTSRARTIRRARMLNPSINELLVRAKAGRPQIWTVTPQDKQFAVATLAYGEMPWTPPYDRPDKITDQAAYAVSQFLETPSMPITTDLRVGGLAIVGDRAAALAAVRHIVLSHSILTGPTDLELVVMAGSQNEADWNWATRLPHARLGQGRALPLIVIDGLSQIGANELRAIIAREEPVGTVVIERELGELPSICSTIMEIRGDGTATLMDFRIGTTITNSATPVGLSDQLANQAAQDLEEAVNGANQSAAKIAVPDHITRPTSPTALPQRRRGT